MKKYFLPLAVLVVVVGFLGFGLKLDPREVPSPLIGKAAPPFSLPVLQTPAKTVSNTDLKGQVWMLNVWASWCVSCREEHPVLVELAKRNIVPIIGLNYKDQSDDARAWLKQFGNPYVMSLVDAKGNIGIDYGVYGVPETYLIDRDGVIRYKKIGPVTPDTVREKILPLVKQLKG
jgi:cytochrome c biogenesis protein CcmG, thiol:disulfide interchange protein DsbE